MACRYGLSGARGSQDKVGDMALGAEERWSHVTTPESVPLIDATHATTDGQT